VTTLQTAGAATVAATSESAVPLCVDLDGTLVRTDTLHENFLLALVKAPWRTLRSLAALRHGKAAFKRALTDIVVPDPALLPVNVDLLDFARGEAARGRELALFSAADQRIVASMAEHLQMFNHCQGSDGRTNLAGDQKLAAIRARYGADFVYVGDTAADLPVWRAARGAVVVSRGDGLVRRVGQVAHVEHRIRSAAPTVNTWLKALRVHQWSKNALLFAPLLLAGPMVGPADYGQTLVGFVVFSCLASVGYIVNDLLDLASDRRHASKRSRPFAAGDLTIREGVTAATSLGVLAAVLAFAVGVEFALVAFLYLAGTLSYSLGLKRVAVLDVIMLSGLFTIRVFAGMILISAPFSFWLLTFSIFLFLSLATVKRYAELANLGEDAHTMFESRGYLPADWLLVAPLGIGSALAAGLIFVIYLVEERFSDDVFTEPGWLWFIFPTLLFWLLRIWRLALHGQMNEDPILFAVTDKVSLVLGAVVLAFVLLAW